MVPLLILLAGGLLSTSVLGAPNEAGGGVIASITAVDQSGETSPVLAEEENSVSIGRYGTALYWGIGLFAIVVVGVIIFIRAWWIPPGYGPFWPVRPETLIGGWIVILLASSAGGFLSTRFLAERSPLEQQALTMIVVYVISLLIIGVLLVLIARARQAFAGEVELRPTPGATVIVWGVIGFIAAFPVAQALGAVVGQIQAWLSGLEPDAIAHETLKGLSEAPGSPWAIVVMVLVVVMAPIVEEFSYRGLVQQSLRGLGANRFSAILLTSFLFVFMHVPVLPPASMAPAVVTLLTVSLFLGWLYERTGQLAVPIIAHALFNAANLALLTLSF